MPSSHPHVAAALAADQSQTGPSVRYLDTATAYDLWSEVYDTDGNFLQALDTIEMKSLLPKLISHITTQQPWRFVDLGCGTGRNTAALISAIPEAGHITALDLSHKMLQVAQTSLNKFFDQQEISFRASHEVEFEVFDMLKAISVPQSALTADAIISTLVVEHVPLDIFFRTAAKMLRKDGLFLVTNMHAEMGRISQAGFVDPQTGEKIRPMSYAHTVQEVLAEAQAHGFEPVEGLKERTVDEQMCLELGPRSRKWVGVTVWFGGIFRKLVDRAE